MKKLISVITMCIFLSGCAGILPHLNFNSPGSTPQSVNKSKIKETCKGKTSFNQNGDVIYCSKGYYNYTQNYVKKERKYTIVEKIKNFINNLTGSMFWIILLLVIFFPGVLGMIFGRVIEGVFGISKRALVSTIKGVQKFRKEGDNLDNHLSISQDNKIKSYIRKIKEKENIK